MVTTPPYLASAEWYAEWLRAVSHGASDSEGCVEANRRLGVRGRDFSRALIPARGGIMTLSVAVAGGAGKLRNLTDPGCVELSLHGNWPHAHLGALEAVYGRAPYYSHLISDLREIYSDLPATLGDFNRGIHSVVISLLGCGKVELTPPALARGRELSGSVKTDLSVIDALMRLGPVATLPLLSMSNVECRM